MGHGEGKWYVLKDEDNGDSRLELMKEVGKNTSNDSQLQLETVLVSGTHYVDVVGHDDDRGLKVTDPQRLTMSNLKETELRS